MAEIGRRFKVGGSIYDIPEASVSNFLSAAKADNLIANEVVSYKVGNRGYHIPVGDESAFLEQASLQGLTPEIQPLRNNLTLRDRSSAGEIPAQPAQPVAGSVPPTTSAPGQNSPLPPSPVAPDLSGLSIGGLPSAEEFASEVNQQEQERIYQEDLAKRQAAWQRSIDSDPIREDGMVTISTRAGNFDVPDHRRVSPVEREEHLKRRNESLMKKLRVDRSQFGKKTAIDAIRENDEEGLLNALNPAAQLGKNLGKGGEQLLILDRLNKGERLTEEERNIALRFALEQKDAERGATGGYQFIKGLTIMPGFMAEFLATSGTATATREATEKAVTATLKKAMKDKLGQKIATGAGKTAGVLTGTAARTAIISQGRAIEDATSRNLGRKLTVDDQGDLAFIMDSEDSLLTDFLRAEGDQYIENLSEVSGVGIKKIGGVIGDRFIKRGLKSSILNRWIKANPGKGLKAFRETLEKIGWNGFLEEMGEERVGDYLRAIVNTEGSEDNIAERFSEAFLDGFNPERLKVEAPLLAVPGATFALTGQTIQAAGNEKLISKIRKENPDITRRQAVEAAKALVRGDAEVFEPSEAAETPEGPGRTDIPGTEEVVDQPAQTDPESEILEREGPASQDPDLIPVTDPATATEQVGPEQVEDTAEDLAEFQDDPDAPPIEGEVLDDADPGIIQDVDRTEEILSEIRTVEELDQAIESQNESDAKVFSRMFPDLSEKEIRQLERSGRLEDAMEERGFGEGTPEYNTIFGIRGTEEGKSAFDSEIVQSYRDELNDVETESDIGELSKTVARRVLSIIALEQDDKPLMRDMLKGNVGKRAIQRAAELGVDKAEFQRMVFNEARRLHGDDILASDAQGGIRDLFEPFFNFQEKEAEPAKMKTTGSFRERILSHPGVAEISDERDEGAGIWVYYKNGYKSELDPNRSNDREENWRELYNRVRKVQQVDSVAEEADSPPAQIPAERSRTDAVGSALTEFVQTLPLKIGRDSQTRTIGKRIADQANAIEEEQGQAAADEFINGAIVRIRSGRSYSENRISQIRAEIVNNLEPELTTEEQAQLAERESADQTGGEQRRLDNLKPADENLQAFRQSHKKIRRPKKDDPLREEILASIPAHRLSKDGQHWDEVLEEARREGLVAQDATSPEDLAPLFQGRLETVGQRASREEREADERESISSETLNVGDRFEVAGDNPGVLQVRNVFEDGTVQARYVGRDGEIRLSPGEDVTVLRGTFEPSPRTEAAQRRAQRDSLSDEVDPFGDPDDVTFEDDFDGMHLASAPMDWRKDVEDPSEDRVNEARRRQRVKGTTEGDTESFKGDTKSEEDVVRDQNRTDPVARAPGGSQSEAGKAYEEHMAGEGDAHSRARRQSTPFELAPEAKENSPEWTKEEAKTKPGRRLLRKLKRDKNGDQIGGRSIGVMVAKAMNAETRVTREQTSKKHPGHYMDRPHLIRVRAGSSIILFHEAGHAMMQLALDKDSKWYKEVEKELLKIAKWPGSFASANNVHEGMAEWVRLKIQEPARVEGLPVSEFIENYMDENFPEQMEAVRDAARLWYQHRDRSVNAFFRSNQKDQTSMNGAWAQIKDVYARMGYYLASGIPLEMKERQIFKTIRRAADDKKEGLRVARQWRDKHMKRIKLAQQARLTIPIEVDEVMQGRKGTKQGVRALNEDGKWVYYSDKSITDIMKMVGPKNWPLFEETGWALTMLDRWNKKQLEYGGLDEGITPDVLEHIVKSGMREIPRFMEAYTAINEMMDALIDMSVDSGMRTQEEADRIRGVYDYYWPMPKHHRQNIGGPTKSDVSAEPDDGVRQAFGSLEGVVNVLEAVEARVTDALRGHYQNELIKSILDAADSMSNDSSLPQGARAIMNRMVVPLKMELRLKGIISVEEQERVIADYLNETMNLEGDDKIKPSEVNLQASGIEMWRAEKPKAVNIIAPIIDGKRQYYQVLDPLVFEMIQSARNPAEWAKWLSRLLTPIGAAKRRVLTENAVFALWNGIARDPVNAVFMGEGRKSIIPGYFLLRGLLGRIVSSKVMPEKYRDMSAKDVRRNSELYSRSMLTTLSAEHQARHSAFVNMLKEGLVVEDASQKYTPEWWASIPGRMFSFFTKPVDILNFITGQRLLSQTFEQLAREGVALYERDRGGTDSEINAAYQQVTGNFGERSGNATLSEVMRTVPFLNASIQILYRQGLRLTDPDPSVRAGTYMRIGWIGMVAALQWVVKEMISDEEDRKRNAERPLEDRLAYMDVKGLRVPFDYGLMGGMQSFVWNTLDEQVADMPIQNRDQFLRQMTARIFNLPGNPAELGFLPPSILTALEVKSNYNFYFGYHIETPWMTQLEPEDRFNIDTPEFYKFLGETFNWSPIRTRYVVRSGMARQLDEIIALTEMINEGDVIPDERSQIPFVGRMFVRNPDGWGSASVQRISELDKKIGALRKRLENTPIDPGKRSQIETQLNALAGLESGMNQIDKLARDRTALLKLGDQEVRVKEIEANMVKIAQQSLLVHPDLDAVIDASRREFGKAKREARRSQ